MEEELTNNLKQYAEKIGADEIGFADPSHFNRYKKGNRPKYYLSNSKVVIVLVKHMYDIILDTWSQKNSKKANFHFLDTILENIAYKIKDYLKSKGYKSKIIPYKPGFYLKEAAALAGIGPIGKNNLLLTKNFGSNVRLRALVSDAPLLFGSPIKKSKYCLNCSLCINECPAEALTAEGYVRNKCLTYNLENLRSLSKYSVIWCNRCIEVCPIGKIENQL